MQLQAQPPDGEPSARADAQPPKGPAQAPAGAAQADAQAPKGEAPPPDEVWSFGRFGDISVYRPKGEARDVALFASGDGGWNLGVVSMARRLAADDTLVAGIDIRHYLAQLEQSSDACVSPATDFENFSRYLQTRLGLRQYLQPTLVGYSSGATLVYATLAEASDGTFKGGLSLGFCPDLELKKPLCKGSGIESTPRRNAKGELEGVDFRPAKKLSARWIALQGELDQVCPADPTRKFATQVPGSEVVMLPKVGHGYSVEKNWLPQYLAAFSRITGAGPQAGTSESAVSDLPLVIVPAKAGPPSPWFAIFLSGDGGWVAFDRGVSEELAKRDIPIVGWDSLKYFWSPRTPEGAAHDLDRVVRHFAEKWHRNHVLLIGFSQGADTIPFMENRLPDETRNMVGLTTLLGISDNALFEFHLANWLGNSGGGLATAPELAHWSGSPYLCLYGARDKDAACAAVTGKGGVIIKMPGGHHFGDSYHRIAAEILGHMPKL
ncbi:MAG TPA: AcvB/VirJ family lysyl-phosphatidylglycerol hydrolase [Steroidobacteraceae bacterium]|jgi:type IV secretory pathway VirJ component|nr:AcvB/VirJ family lysyl-phosphatidylglycerol hydrolase [Steroidobacteraceae bacterium]